MLIKRIYGNGIKRRAAAFVLAAVLGVTGAAPTGMLYVNATSQTSGSATGDNKSTTDSGSSMVDNKSTTDSGSSTGENKSTTDSGSSMVDNKSTTDSGSSTGDNKSTTDSQSTTGDSTAAAEQTADATDTGYKYNSQTGYIESTLSPKEAKVLVIDPGHCKKHPGARGHGLKEEVVNLDIAEAFRDYLTGYGDITIYMTRESGACCTNLELGDCLTARSRYSKKLDADFLVSVHINAGHSNGANALAAYKSDYHDEVRVATQEYGRLALLELKKLGIANRGYYLRKTGSGARYKSGKLKDYYAIVRHGVEYGIPGIIMEHGYLTSASDCKKFFKTKAQRKKVGIADAKAMITYYKLSKQTVQGEFKDEGSDTYYVSTDGRKVTGWVKDGEMWFYFDKKSAKMATGWLKQGEDTYYLSPSTGEAVVGWFEVDGKTYMSRGNGTVIKGCMHGDGIGTYLFDNNGRKLTRGFHTISNNVYYVENSKSVALGVKRIGFKYYGFDDETGIRLTGEQTIDGRHYCFDKTTGAAERNKIVEIKGKKYYFGSKAYGETGWVKKGLSKYYFYKKTGVMVTGWKKIKGKYYYFDEETGKMQKNKWIDNYYVNKKGIRTKKR